MDFEAVIFDADETIFNNQGIHEIIVEQILEDLGLSLSLVDKLHSLWDTYYFTEHERLLEENGFCIDKDTNASSLVKALKGIGKDISLQEAKRYWSFMIREYSLKSRPYTDVLDLIDYLRKKKIKMGIVSNGDREIINLRLKNSKIKKYFKFVIAPCKNYPLSKPNLKIFADSLALLNTTAEKTIFIGDNPQADIVGANRAGIFSVLVDRNERFSSLKGDLKPNIKVKNLEEIKTIFQ
ncbi:MAG: HAD-IA family hydrolase [Asgard group archaeon]|nr:HAD-IA family hydrolase [Asgard group archaeon]